MGKQALIGPLVMLTALLVTVLWVHDDASRRADQRDPVVAAIGSLQIETAAAWSIGCLLLWVLFFPLYLRARKA